MQVLNSEIFIRDKHDVKTPFLALPSSFIRVSSDKSGTGLKTQLIITYCLTTVDSEN